MSEKPEAAEASQIKSRELNDLMEKMNQAWDRGENTAVLNIIYRMIEKAPESYFVWMLKAIALKEFEQYDEAIEAANKAIDLNPLGKKIHGAWLTLGAIAKDREQFREAVRCFSKMVESWEDFNSYTILAASELQFDAELAAFHAKKALELNPDWDEAQNILAKAEAKIAVLPSK